MLVNEVNWIINYDKFGRNYDDLYFASLFLGHKLHNLPVENNDDDDDYYQ